MLLSHKDETSNYLYVIFPPLNRRFEIYQYLHSGHLFLQSAFSLLLRAATDHNSDNTTAILKEWLTVMQKFYHYVEWRPMDKPT